MSGPRVSSASPEVLQTLLAGGFRQISPPKAFQRLTRREGGGHLMLAE